MRTEPKLDSLADALLAHVQPVATELVEDPVTTIEVLFGPVRVCALPQAWTSDECSCDGYYDTHVDPERPWILYDSSVTPKRRAHTLLHEFGHHLLATECCELLDGLDELAGDDGDSQAWEERLCHRFAARLLIPDELLDAVVCDDAVIRPAMVRQLFERGNASWEASALRLSERLPQQACIVLMRQPGFVAFSAGHVGSGVVPWYRGSRVQPDGALSRAFNLDQRARPDTFRYGQAYAANCYADTLRVRDGLVVAVLSTQPSIRRPGQAIARDEPEPLWKMRDELCPRCGEEFTRGWCDVCSRRQCHLCNWCGCWQESEQRVCKGCWTKRPAGAFAANGLCLDQCAPT